jgi:hypothetical protein
VKSPSGKAEGIVAILDALGAATYSDAEIAKFLDSRRRVLALLEDKIDDLSGRIDANEILVFTFNDTILIAYRPSKGAVELKEIETFFILLRKFLSDSLTEGILFRGSVAIGSFLGHDETNTLMGQAVTDAAAWYEAADWVGIHATPRTSLIIDRHTTTATKKKSNFFLHYEVPLKGDQVLKTKAVNWPRMFYNPALPSFAGANPLAKVLELLTSHSVPLGTETKYFNTVRFFKRSLADWKKQLPTRREKTRS